MTKDEFITKIEDNVTIYKGPFSYFKFNDVYYYLCENGTCNENFSNVDDLWECYKD